MNKFLITAILSIFLFPTTLLAQAFSCADLSAKIATTPAPPAIVGNYKAALNVLDNIPERADVVLVGDSLFANWARTVKDAFPNQTVFDFAVGGDRTQQILWRFEQAKLRMNEPKAVVVLAGTNNISDGGTTACGVFEGLKAIIREARIAWGNAPIFVVTVPPRGADFQDYDVTRQQYNALIEDIPNQMQNVFPVVIDEREVTCGNVGKPKLSPLTLSCSPEGAYKCQWYRADNLHFTDPAYVLIRRYIGEAGIRFLNRDVFLR